MRGISLRLASLFAIAAIHAGMTTAAHSSPSSSLSAREYGTTLPPVGFVQFCKRVPQNCKPEAAHRRFTMTNDKWLTVRMVNSFVNGAIAPVDDETLYGEAEYWTLPTDAGDCEDIMLLKKKLLVAEGIAAEALRITVVLDENGGGHAVLTLITSDGDYVLDNRRNDIRLWSTTGYTFLKRQANHNSKEWVSLRPATNNSSDGQPGTGSN